MTINGCGEGKLFYPVKCLNILQLFASIGRFSFQISKLMFSIF